MSRILLPPGLAGRAFSVAEAADAGLGEGRLRGRDLSRPLHGLRGDGLLTDAVALARGARLVLPDDVAFSHCTAAALLGLPVPRRREHLWPLHAMRPSGRNRIDRPECLAHRGLESRETTHAHGVPVVGMADTWCDLADLLGLDDLVVLGDAVATRLGTVTPLAEALGRRTRPRGARVLREALRWVRVGSGSPMESRTRLLFVRSGLPEPELNVQVSHDDGGFLCVSDFVWRRQRVIGEYQGADHFESFGRGDDDISRRLLAEDSRWKYIEVTKNDYFNAGRRHSMLSRFARYLGVEGAEFRPSRALESRFPTPSTVCRVRG